MRNDEIIKAAEESKDGKVVLPTNSGSQIFKGGAVGEMHHIDENGTEFYEFDADEVKKSAELRSDIFDGFIQTGQQSVVTDL
jgi:hypothetical protein